MHKTFAEYLAVLRGPIEGSVNVMHTNYILHYHFKPNM